MSLIACPECKKRISETVEYCPNCGYRFFLGETVKLKEKQQRNNFVAFIAIALLIFVFLKQCPNGNKSDSTISWDQKDNRAGAWVYTKMYVKNNLKSPSSAKFPGSYSGYIQQNGTTYTINSYVDSQNSFGAMIRTYFNATVKEVSEDRWEMISFKFSE